MSTLTIRNRRARRSVRTEPVEVPRRGFDRLSPNGFYAIECKAVSNDFRAGPARSLAVVTARTSPANTAASRPASARAKYRGA